MKRRRRRVLKSSESIDDHTGVDIEPEPQRRGDKYADEHRGSPHDGGRCGQVTVRHAGAPDVGPANQRVRLACAAIWFRKALIRGLAANRSAGPCQRKRHRSRTQRRRMDRCHVGHSSSICAAGPCDSGSQRNGDPHRRQPITKLPASSGVGNNCSTSRQFIGSVECEVRIESSGLVRSQWRGARNGSACRVGCGEGSVCAGSAAREHAVSQGEPADVGARADAYRRAARAVEPGDRVAGRGEDGAAGLVDLDAAEGEHRGRVHQAGPHRDVEQRVRPRSTRRTNSAGLPMGSASPLSMALLCASTVALRPSASMPTLRATSVRVDARRESANISAAAWAR
jgi:hypothetical protein